MQCDFTDVDDEGADDALTVMLMADGPRLEKAGFLVPQAPRYQDFSGPLHDDWIHSDLDTITNRSSPHQPHVAQRLDGKESFRCESLTGAAEAAGARKVAGDLGGNLETA